MINRLSPQTPYNTGGSGDGSSLENAAYWYSLELDDPNTYGKGITLTADKPRFYIKLHLDANINYYLSIDSSTSGTDTYLRLYDTNGTLLADNDDYYNYDNDDYDYNKSEISFMPQVTGDYIISCAAYGDALGTIDFVRCNPAPNRVDIPPEQTVYPTSSGVNALGRTKKFRSASSAGINKLVIPKDFLIFEALENSVTGSNWNGSVTDFREYYGVQCAYFGGNNYLYDRSFKPSVFTASCYACIDPAGLGALLTAGTWTNSTELRFGNSTVIYAARRSPEWCGVDGVAFGIWRHYTMACSKNVRKLYIDGELVNQALNDNRDITTGFAICTDFTSGGSPDRDTNMIAGVRNFYLYDRILDDKEIKALSKELPFI